MISPQDSLLPSRLHPFPLLGASAFRINTSDGLPSNFVQQLAAVDEQLFAWVGERGYLASFVSIDLASRDIRTLASCQRKQQLTPLDDFPHASCGLMIVTQHKKMVVMAIDAGIDPDTNRYSNRNGFWAYQLAVEKIKKFYTSGFVSES